MSVRDRVTRTSVFTQLLLVCCCLSLGHPPCQAGPESGATARSATGVPPALDYVPPTGLTTATGVYDAGEFLRIGSRKIPLLRSRQKVAVIQAPAAGIQAAAQPEQIETKDRLYRFERYIRPSGVSGPAGRPRVTVFQTRKFASADEQTQSMRRLEQETAAEEVVPVYIHGDSGLEMIPTGKIVVKLKVKDDLASLSALNRRLGTSIDRRIRGTADQYILAAPHTTARQLFDLCDALAKEPALEWAEPDFISQVVRHSYHPDDPFCDPNQWYLKDINAPQAWEIVTGSNQIIIALIDDGMDLQHEDLKGALPSNAGETPDNGVDDDHNGWKDDVNGWNFHDDDNNPNPASPYDNHGTQVAGVAAATGDNGKGIAGCAFGCKLMPLKVLEGDSREEKLDVIYGAIAEALYYAAGQTEDGHNRWRGADVISISLGFPETNLVNAALKFAVQEGRNGKGCPTFCASGNSAAGWMEYRIYGIDAGTHHFRWELARDGSGSEGSDTAWMDSIIWPGGTPELLQSSNLPADWQTGGEAQWVAVQNDAEGNHAMTGWTGPSSRAVRPGPIDHWGRSYLDVKKTGPAGYVDFSIWTSLQQSYPCYVGDSFYLSLDYYPFCVLGTPQNRRVQFICLRDELGWDPLTPLPARTLKFAEFQMIIAPTQRMDELTIRMKQIAPGRDRYDSAQWDDAGWTTVFHGTDVPLNTGTCFELAGGTRINLVRFNFTRDFPYDPNYNLAVDISMAQSRSGVLGSLCLSSLTTETRTIEGEEYYMYGARPGWITVPPQLSNWVPMMWLGSGDELRFFVDGMLMAKASGVAPSATGVSYPASNPYTVAVGASTDFGRRSDYSQFGTDLDLVAPSSGGMKGIFTTDRTGSKGDDPNNYSSYFGGTSAATPLTSGVAALMLSRNPALTSDQIRTILRQTCQKIGDDPYTDGRNEHYGYGRIDAQAAVKAAGN